MFIFQVFKFLKAAQIQPSCDNHDLDDWECTVGALVTDSYQ